MKHTFLICLLIMAASVPAQDNSRGLENPYLEMRCQADKGTFSLRARPSGRLFLPEGKLLAGGGAVRPLTRTDKNFGEGRGFEFSWPNGNRESILLYSKLPSFALFRVTLQNSGKEMLVTNQVRALSASLEFGRPAGDLRTLGTGGLLPPAKNPGSYAWLAVADPKSRSGVVGGWLTHDRASGILFAKEAEGRVQLEAQLDYGRLRIAPGKSETLETFAFGWFDDARLGLEAWADAVAKVYEIKLPPQPIGYCTWYSKPYGGASDEKHLAEQAAFAAKHLAPFGFSVIQIDDHWQAGVSTNGPKRNFTTHAPKGPYPSGMKAAADNVKALGLTPGLWFMPFAGTFYDPFFKDHQDWFAKRTNGQPYETAWGGTCLDMTHPGARDYLRGNIRRFAEDWGFQYFKMDGLWTGTATRQQYVNEGYKPDGMGDAVLHNPEKTNLEAYRDGLKLIREAAGRKVFFLGCCSPQNMRSYGGAFGLVDAMRIGPDNGANWKGLLRGPTFGTRQYFLNGRVWYNDPDPVYVRAGVPSNQAQAICSWVTISGQLNLNSEWLPGLPPERLDILKRTMPSHGLLPRPADLFEEPLPRIWLLTDNRRAPRRDVIGLFNWDAQERRFDYPLERIGLDGQTDYVAFDYWGNAVVDSIRGNLQIRVPAQSCRVLALRPRLERPQLLSTSRHITQGMVDVLEEEWRERPKILRGRSKIVGHDPYELRIITRGKEKNWKTLSASVSTPDQLALVKTAFEEKDGLTRVRLESPVSRDVEWEVRFEDK